MSDDKPTPELGDEDCDRCDAPIRGEIYGCDTCDYLALCRDCAERHHEPNEVEY